MILFAKAANINNNLFFHRHIYQQHALQVGFFTFDDKHLPLGSFCPEPVKILEAIGEDFEGGRVLRYAPDPAYTADQRGIVYVIYNDGEWLTYPDVWDPSQPSNAPSLVVPNGRYQPVDSIGKVWRENADVRNRLDGHTDRKVNSQAGCSFI